MYAILASLMIGATPTGPLTADAPSVDLGEVRTGPPIVRTFTVTNRGGGDIAISGVEATCGCLKPVVSPQGLKPGESATVSLAVNTLTQPAGPNTWKATVRYRHGTDPQALELRLSATLVAEVTVTPPVVAVSTTREASQTILVSDRRAKPLGITAVSPSHPHLTAVVWSSETVDGVRTHRVELNIAESFPAGQFDETLTLLTDDPTCRELRVPVRVTKREPLAVVATPAALDFTYSAQANEPSRLVQVRRPNGGPVQIHAVESGHAAVRAKWSDAAGPVATVRVVLANDPSRGASGQSEVRIRLREPAGQELVVPVRWSGP